MEHNIQVIGIDCAVDPKKVGLSLGIYCNGKLQLLEVQTGKNKTPIADSVFNMINRQNKTLIAIDAPLGWPENMGRMLGTHNAGDPLPIEDNLLFRRETDRFIKQKIGKQSLDVGADRIARTAFAALKILKDLRLLMGTNISLAWNDAFLDPYSVIEVYPAATLVSHNLPCNNYKDYGRDPIKEQIISGIENLIELPENRELIRYDSNALDSVICLLAAKDFLDGQIYHAENLLQAQKEGWIWVYKSKT